LGDAAFFFGFFAFGVFFPAAFFFGEARFLGDPGFLGDFAFFVRLAAFFGEEGAAAPADPPASPDEAAAAGAAFFLADFGFPPAFFAFDGDLFLGDFFAPAFLGERDGDRAFLADPFAFAFFAGERGVAGAAAAGAADVAAASSPLAGDGARFGDGERLAFLADLPGDGDRLRLVAAFFAPFDGDRFFTAFDGDLAAFFFGDFAFGEAPPKTVATALDFPVVGVLRGILFYFFLRRNVKMN